MLERYGTARRFWVQVWSLYFLLQSKEMCVSLTADSTLAAGIARLLPDECHFLSPLKSQSSLHWVNGCPRLTLVLLFYFFPPSAPFVTKSFFSFTRWGLCSCSSSTFFQQLVYCHIKFTLIIKLICAKKGVYILFTLSFVCCCCFSLFTRTALTVKGFTERHMATQLHRVGGWRF